MERTNGLPACASCKHQRKKCTDKCILAPFFPVEKSREFQAVHKVFGVSNVAKVLKNLSQEERERAADSLIWEALSWQRDPVDGPYGDYKRVFEELRLYRNQYMKTSQVAKQSAGNMMYKAAAAGAPVLFGWNNNNKSMNINGGIINTNGTGLSCNGNSAIDSSCSYSYAANLEKQWRGDNGSAVILAAPQQHSINGFNQQYFLATAGQYNSTDVKTVESSLWEDNS